MRERSRYHRALLPVTTNRTVLTALVALLMMQAPPRSASAEDVLALYVDPALALDVEGLRAGLAADLGYEVTFADEGAARLSIASREGGAELRYEDDGAARVRRVELPADPAEAGATLVLIGANLVRDPTDQLVGAAPEAAPAVPEPPREEVAPETPEPPVPSFAVQNPFRLSLGILAGAASTRSGVSGYWYLGLDLMGTVHPNISIGITRLSFGFGFSSVESFIFSLQGTPTLEVSAFVDPHVQAYGQIGVALQGRAQTAFREGYFQVAPFVGGGVRFWANDWITIGLEIGLDVVATDAFLMGEVELPQGSVAGSGALNVGFHF